VSCGLFIALSWTTDHSCRSNNYFSRLGGKVITQAGTLGEGAKAQRLQLGTSRLEALSSAALSVVLDKRWIHLGDRREPFVNHVVHVIRRKKPWFTELSAMYRKTDFREFWFRPGDRLPFEDNSLSYIFSEHFVEHLPHTLALELFRECYRALKAGGVLRTAVPDAKLRSYEPPEPQGWPIDLPPDHPAKHKVRWTVTLLSKAVEGCGFRAVPLDYCTEDHLRVQHAPEAMLEQYNRHVKCADWAIVSDVSYIMRMPSLTVDAIKDR